MSKRLYISKYIGDGLSLETAYRPVWLDLLNNQKVKKDKVGHTIHSSGFCIAIINTNKDQHTLLIEDSKIIYIPKKYIKQFNKLNKHHKIKLKDLLFSNNIDIATWSMIINWLNNNSKWNPSAN